MQPARIFNAYRYKREIGLGGEDTVWNLVGNIGDCIQSIAIEKLYQECNIDVSDIALVNRDEIDSYDGEECLLPMQGWFGNQFGIFPLPWSERITPLFIGFHLSMGSGARLLFQQRKVDRSIKVFAPVGCRDRSTRDFLRSLGVEAYFSGCMTLTLDRRPQEPAEGKVFIVNLIRAALEKLPRHILEQADFSITHSYIFNHYPIEHDDALEFENCARRILERYKAEARLVITSRIHVAMPCLAMGIPVVFITDNLKDERFDVLQGILPLYTVSEMDCIDWHYYPDRMEFIKGLITNNAIQMIKAAKQREHVESNAQQELIAYTKAMLPIYVSERHQKIMTLGSNETHGKSMSRARYFRNFIKLMFYKLCYSCAGVNKKERYKIRISKIEKKIAKSARKV